MKGITPKQQSVLKLIGNYIRRNGYPPTIREVSDHLGINSTNGANDHLKALEKKGYIRRSPGVSRGIQLLKREPPGKKPRWLAVRPGGRELEVLPSCSLNIQSPNPRVSGDTLWSSGWSSGYDHGQVNVYGFGLNESESLSDLLNTLKCMKHDLVESIRVLEEVTTGETS